MIDSISEKVRWQGSEKLIIVIDAGISSEDNLIELHKSGYDYICVSRSEHQKYRKMLNNNDLKEILFDSNSAKHLSITDGLKSCES